MGPQNGSNADAGAAGAGAAGADAGARPSDARRRALRAAESRPPLLSNFCPIERYYAAADKVMSAFDAAVAEGDLDAAYIYGRRFATFSTDALPTHDYYHSTRPNHIRLVTKNRRDLDRVVNDLERVVERMDADEAIRQKREAKEREKREEMERLRRKAMEMQRRREEADRRRLEAEEERRADREREDSLAAKLSMLNERFPRAPDGAAGAGGTLGPYASVPSFSGLFDSHGELPLPIAGDLPPPLLPPPDGAPPPAPEGSMPPPPSYSELMGDRTGEDGASADAVSSAVDGTGDPPPPPYAAAAAAGGAAREATAAEDLLGGDGGSVPPPLYPVPTPSTSGPYVPAEPDGGGATSAPPPKKKKAPQVPVRTLRRAYTSDYDAMKRKKLVEVFFLSTYQGRIKAPGRDSTNGCTVISPLVAARHLRSEGAGIADVAIEDVIDREAPPILRTVRRKLGLPGDALIIPSDVHDYLVDQKILRQDYFVGVCGGNILDPDHLSEFLDLLENGYDRGNKEEEKKAREEGRGGARKVAAALFFHEHVMSIIKVVPSNGDSWYDIVDSLPHRESRGDGKASRTRCKDRVSLEATLRWYACSKFSETDCAYIDRNDWDDAMCDFDPRVYQAFVWASN